MKPTEEIAREFLDETKGLPDSIRHKELVRLLNKVRREQDKITSNKCAEACVVDWPSSTVEQVRIRNIFHDICMNVKAV
jgi:hypothetical protein